MNPLEQVAILMTLMRRLEQILDHERRILGGMRLDALPDLQEEKDALSEAYEIELRRLRARPEQLGELEPLVREQLECGMRDFQKKIAANFEALRASQSVVEGILKNIAGNLAKATGSASYGAGARLAGAAGGGRVIPIAFDRQL